MSGAWTDSAPRIHIGAEQEDAAVPGMAARRQHRLGLVPRRLFDEAVDAVDAGGDLLADLRSSHSRSRAHRG